MKPIRAYMNHELKKMYEDGMSIQDIAQVVGISYTATRYRLKKENTELRGRNGKKKNVSGN